MFLRQYILAIAWMVILVDRYIQVKYYNWWGRGIMFLRQYILAIAWMVILVDRYIRVKYYIRGGGGGGGGG